MECKRGKENMPSLNRNTVRLLNSEYSRPSLLPAGLARAMSVGCQFAGNLLEMLLQRDG